MSNALVDEFCDILMKKFPTAYVANLVSQWKSPIVDTDKSTEEVVKFSPGDSASPRIDMDFVRDYCAHHDGGKNLSFATICNWAEQLNYPMELWEQYEWARCPDHIYAYLNSAQGCELEKIMQKNCFYPYLLDHPLFRYLHLRKNGPLSEEQLEMTYRGIPYDEKANTKFGGLSPSMQEAILAQEMNVIRHLTITIE